MTMTPAQVSASIAKGTFRPHVALTNMAMSYFQDSKNYFAKSIFPILPVSLSADNYYIFSKEDLLRDGWNRKPAYGKVMPTVVAETTGTYVCKVDQMIMGIDEIRQTDLQRRQGPALKDPRMQRTKTIAEQANIHQDIMFAKNFFKTGVWGNEWKGVDTTATNSKEFIKFSNGNSDPIRIINEQKREIQRQTGRIPNKLVMGTEVFDALLQHPGILERVKYGGTTANPANVTMNVLAQLFGLEEVRVMESIRNQARQGADADMGFIGDPKGMLLAYATSAPSIEEPSAGYIFSWDMLGDGQILPIANYPGEPGTHSEYIEGLMAYDMKKTADDLAVFFHDVV